jgi:hypothetical protein
VDLEQQLLLQRQLARISELEGWLALMVVLHGTRNGDGYRYTITAQHAQTARARLPVIEPAIAIEYDFPADQHVIDVL